MKWRRVGIGATIACLLMLCAWQTTAVQRIETYGTDSSYYQVLAHNLATHRGYVFDFKPHTLYPPGFPAILALSTPIVGDGYHSFILLMPLFGTVGLIGTFLLLDREENWVFGAAACLWVATSPQLFRAATQDVLSDLPYFAVSAAALVAVPSIVLLPALVAVAVLIRSAGLTLVAAAVATLAITRVRNPIEWLTRPETRALPGAILAGTAAQLLWLRWAIPRAAAPQWPGDAVESYARQMFLKDPHQPSLGLAGLTDLGWRMRDGAAVQVAHFSELLTRVDWIDRHWFSPLVVFPFLLMVIGAVVSLAQGRSKFLVWYIAAYVGLYSLWPFDEGPRFMLPVFPLLLLLLWRGIEAVRRQATVFAGSARALVVPAALAVLGFAALWSFRSLPARGDQAAASVAFWFVAALASLPFVFKTSQASRASVARLGRRAVELAGGHAVMAAVLIFLIGTAGGLFTQSRIRRANRHPAPTKFESTGTLNVARWLRSQPPADVVMAQQTAIFHRLTGRRVVMFPLAPDGSLVAEAIRQNDVSYLVVTRAGKYDYFRPSEPERFEALSAADPDCCRLVHVDGDYRIYAIAK